MLFSKPIRVEDLRRVANDDAYRDKLFQELGIA